MKRAPLGLGAQLIDALDQEVLDRLGHGVERLVSQPGCLIGLRLAAGLGAELVGQHAMQVELVGDRQLHDPLRRVLERAPSMVRA